MTTTYSHPTVGEHAGEILSDVLRLRGGEAAVGENSEVRLAATGLIRSCFALMEKFPRQARRDFETTLPFTGLELQLLRRCPADDSDLADVIAIRLGEWVNRSPIFVDEANVHVVDFLRRLGPLLDTWDQRSTVEDLIEKTTV